MRLLLVGRHHLKPLLQVEELLEQIIDYLDFPSVICLMMSNKGKFGINSPLMMNPNLWVNLVIRYDCVRELTCRHACLRGLEDIEAMNDKQRKDFSVKCMEILSEQIQLQLKKYKLVKADNYSSHQDCQVCGDLIEEGELIVLYSIEGKVASFNEYFHWDCITTEVMEMRKIRKSEIECSNVLLKHVKVEKFFKRVDESKNMRRQKLFGVVCDECLKFQSSRYYYGIDLDENRVDLCLGCFSKKKSRDMFKVLEKRKPSLITCNICKDPIKDSIFSCQYCDYYSVCENCFQSIPKTNIHFEHPFTLVGCKACKMEIVPKKRKLPDKPITGPPTKKTSLIDLAKSMGFEDLT